MNSNNKDKYSWLDDVREKLADMQSPPSPGAWDGIISRLDKGVSVAPRYSRRWLWAASVALLMASGFLLLFIKGGEVENNALLAETGSMAVEHTVCVAVDDKDIPAESEDSEDEMHCSGKHEQIISSVTSVSPDSELIEGFDIKTDTLASSDINMLTAHCDTAYSTDKYVDCGAHSSLVAYDYRSIGSYKRSRMAVSLYTYSSFGGSLSKEFISMVKGAPAKTGMGNLRRAVSQRWHPSVPVSFGASLNYGITDCIGVESGLVYTFLRQQRDVFFSDRSFESDRNTVHYLGIPVKFKFSLVRLWNFRIYCAASVRMDFTLSNKNRLAPPTDDCTGSDGLQWSASASGGIEYSFGRLGLYAEPGISYYFRNNGNRPTIFSDYPVAFSAEAGLRINL